MCQIRLSPYICDLEEHMSLLYCLRLFVVSKDRPQPRPLGCLQRVATRTTCLTDLESTQSCKRWKTTASSSPRIYLSALSQQWPAGGKNNTKNLTHLCWQQAKSTREQMPHPLLQYYYYYYCACAICTEERVP